MPSQCLFELDHPNAVYYSGQTINGTIRLNTTEEKQVRNVRIVFSGEGKVKWDESCTSTDANGRTTTTTIYYTSHEVYVNNESYVRGEGPLPLGLHTYTFSITLPMECPTSCEGRFGHIRYGLSLILDRVLRFDNVYHMPLTVLQTVDLNLNPVFKLPLLVEDVRSLCCWPCDSGKLVYSLRVPFGAYSCGQTVKFSLGIQNQSMVDTDGYTVEFWQKMKFTARTPSLSQRQHKICLLKKDSPESCLRLTNRVFEDTFRIPSVPPTTDPSSIIHIEYIVKLTLRLRGCHNSKDLSVPIFIGNIPLRESLAIRDDSFSHNPTAPELLQTKENSSSDMAPSYQDLKPPSYEATIQSGSPFVDHDVDKHHRVVGFRPLYPMYS